MISQEKWIEKLFKKAPKFDKKLEEHLELYASSYPKDLLRTIRMIKWNPDPAFSKSPTMMQIYAAIGLYPDQENVYKGFVDVVKTHIGIDKNIVAMCSGAFPIMPLYIDQEQRKLGKGSITSYDSKTIVSKLGTINIIKENLLSGTSLVKTDAIVAHNACDGVYDAIDLACENKLEAVISPCDGIPGEEGFEHNCTPTESYEFHNYLFSYFQRNLPEGFTLCRVYMYPDYRFSNPVFVSKKIKKA